MRFGQIVSYKRYNIDNKKKRFDVFQDKVFLTATDTTIGFVSQDADRLTRIKVRPPHKHYIRAVDSLQTLRYFTRVPSAHKKALRRAKRTTFIMPDGNSFRVVKDPHHLLLLGRMKWAYTTSANRSGRGYDEAFALSHADVIVAPLQERSQASKIIKLGKHRRKRIR